MTAAHAKAAFDEAEPFTPEPPRPLRRPLPPPDPFPVEALGDVLGAAARGIQDKTQAPLAICAQSVLAAATLAVQGFADVQLPTGQTRPVSGYFVTVAASGERKTSADTEALWPIRKHEENLRIRFDAEMPGYRRTGPLATAPCNNLTVQRRNFAMTITTKAGLAAELGISKARVSQYVKRGLPVLTSGKLDREQALHWITRNTYYTLSSHGSTRARQLIR